MTINENLLDVDFSETAPFGFHLSFQTSRVLSALIETNPNLPEFDGPVDILHFIRALGGDGHSGATGFVLDVSGLNIADPSPVAQGRAALAMTTDDSAYIFAHAYHQPVVTIADLSLGPFNNSADTSTDNQDVFLGTENADNLSNGTLDANFPDNHNLRSGNDIAFGRGGNDVISGGNNYDLLFGGDGNDILDGLNYSDQVYGDAGHDTLYGGAGSDALFGGTENDLLIDGLGLDVFDGGAGNDTLVTRSDSGEPLRTIIVDPDDPRFADLPKLSHSIEVTDVSHLGLTGDERLISFESLQDIMDSDDQANGDEDTSSSIFDQIDTLVDPDANLSEIYIPIYADTDGTPFALITSPASNRGTLLGMNASGQFLDSSGNVMNFDDADVPVIGMTSLNRTTGDGKPTSNGYLSFTKLHEFDEGKDKFQLPILVAAKGADARQNDELTGGAGSDLFVIEFTLGADPDNFSEEGARDILDFTQINRLNGSRHNHWVDGIGNDVIVGFDNREDIFAAFGHTARIEKVEAVDGDFVVHFYSDHLEGTQSTWLNGQAVDLPKSHHLDYLGSVTFQDSVFVDENGGAMDAAQLHAFLEDYTWDVPLHAHHGANLQSALESSVENRGISDAHSVRILDYLRDVHGESASNLEFVNHYGSFESKKRFSAYYTSDLEISSRHQDGISTVYEELQNKLVKWFGVVGFGDSLPLRIPTLVCDGVSLVQATGQGPTQHGDASDNIIYLADLGQLSNAGAGDDIVFGADMNVFLLGADKIYLEEGNDTGYGGTLNDHIFGGSGNDRILGGGFAVNNRVGDDDLLFGGDGDDIIEGGPGQDGLYGGSGNDRIISSSDFFVSADNAYSAYLGAYYVSFNLPKEDNADWASQEGAAFDAQSHRLDSDTGEWVAFSESSKGDDEDEDDDNKALGISDKNRDSRKLNDLLVGGDGDDVFEFNILSADYTDGAGTVSVDLTLGVDTILDFGQDGDADLIRITAGDLDAISIFATDVEIGANDAVILNIVSKNAENIYTFGEVDQDPVNGFSVGEIIVVGQTASSLGLILDGSEGINGGATERVTFVDGESGLVELAEAETNYAYEQYMATLGLLNVVRDVTGKTSLADGTDGRDYFLMLDDDAHDSIKNFDVDNDRIDLSAFGSGLSFDDLVAPSNKVNANGDVTWVQVTDPGGKFISLRFSSGELEASRLSADNFIFSEEEIETFNFVSGNFDSSDVMKGTFVADMFVLANDIYVDRIKDFDLEDDKIDVSEWGITSFDQLVQEFSPSDNHIGWVEVSDLDGHVVRLRYANDLDLETTDLTADHFLLA